MVDARARSRLRFAPAALPFYALASTIRPHPWAQHQAVDPSRPPDPQSFRPPGDCSRTTVRMGIGTWGRFRCLALGSGHGDGSGVWPCRTHKMAGVSATKVSTSAGTPGGPRTGGPQVVLYPRPASRPPDHPGTRPPGGHGDGSGVPPSQYGVSSILLTTLVFLWLGFFLEYGWWVSHPDRDMGRDMGTVPVSGLVAATKRLASQQPRFHFRWYACGIAHRRTSGRTVSATTSVQTTRAPGHQTTGPVDDPRIRPDHSAGQSGDGGSRARSVRTRRTVPTVRRTRNTACWAARRDSPEADELVH